MTTRPYSDLLATVEALCGAELATAERARIKYFVNRRARKAYAESRYWPRFLKVEERIVSEDGLLPYEQDGLSTIGTVFRVHATEPYQRTTSMEYIDFAATGAGIQITNYQPRQLSEDNAMEVSGAINPNYTGFYEEDATSISAAGYPSFTSTSDTNIRIFFILGQWFVATLATNPPLWYGGDSGNASPDTVTSWSTLNGASGTISVTEAVRYAVYVTYKAALTDTYGDEDGEESDVPEEWFDYLIAASYSDFLRNDGQNEKAMAEEANANELLQQQLERLDTSGSFLFGKILSHNTTQTR